MTPVNPQHIIPLHKLRMNFSGNDCAFSKEIFSDIINDLTIFHKVYFSKGHYTLILKNDSAVFLIVLKGTGLLTCNSDQQILEKESIVVIPQGTLSIVIEMDEREPLHFLQFTKAYSEEDKANLRSSRMSSSKFYSARFQDCKPYTEKIKSPNTISRTVLPGDIIPRVALGTVEALGPDTVGKHSHPMLEQLFLGLENNDITVYADNDKCEMGEFSLLHIPLGSTHWVEVREDSKMNYMWMDFFLTKAGEVWLDTHKAIDNNDRASATP